MQIINKNLIPLAVLSVHIALIVGTSLREVAKVEPPKLLMLDMAAVPEQEPAAPARQPSGDTAPKKVMSSKPNKPAMPANNRPSEPPVVAPAKPVPMPEPQQAKPKPVPTDAPQPTKPAKPVMQNLPDSKHVAEAPPQKTAAQQRPSESIDQQHAEVSKQAASPLSGNTAKPAVGQESGGKDKDKQGSQQAAGGGKKEGATAPASHIGGYLHNPKPPYPELSRENEEEGSVRLAVTVEADGHPSSVRVAGSSGFSRLDRAAEQAVWKYRFRPAMRNGEPVRSDYVFSIRFSLD